MAVKSFDDLFNLGKAEMILRRPDLFLAPGDVTDFILAAAAAMGDSLVQLVSEALRKTFVDGATGDDLTTLADDHFSIQRSAANSATVELSVSRSTGPLPAGSLLAGHVFATVEDENGTRQEFSTLTAVTWAASETGTKTVFAQAVTAGIAGNVGAGTIINSVDNLFDPNISVTNSVNAAGGAEAESDEALRERIRTFPLTLRRGTVDALERGALTVPSVSVANAVEDLNTGLVTVYVTDSSGNSTTQMASDVLTELEGWRCAGTVVSVVGGTLTTQAITLTLSVKSGSDVDAIAANVILAVTARVAKLSVGETLRREIISSAAIEVDPDRIVGVTVVTPAADVAPAANELIRAGTVTIS